MRVVFLIGVIGISLISTACPKEGKDLMKAKYLYSHMAFTEAIPYYKKIVGDSNDPAILAQLGDCYRLTNDMQQAAEWYGRAVKLEGCKDAVKLCYGQILMKLMQYDEAEKWLVEYQKTNTGDKRVANLIVGCRIARDMLVNAQGVNAQMLDINTNGSEFAPVLWKGKLVFTADTAIGIKKKKDNWTGHSYCDIYSVECSKGGDCNNIFHKVATTKEMHSRYHNGPCSFTADGKTMYFTRTRYEHSLKSKLSLNKGNGVAPLEIMIASGYDETKNEFKQVTPFQYNSKSYSVAHPAISPDGNILIFCSDMPGGEGGTDLYICTKSQDGQWSKPQNMGSGINTEGEEVFPCFSDNSTLYFSSDGHAGFGGLDIYQCLLSKNSRTFTAIRNMETPFNSSYDDFSFAISETGAWFSSNRLAEKKGDNIYFCKKDENVVPAAKKDTVRTPSLANTANSANKEDGGVAGENNRSPIGNKTGHKEGFADNRKDNKSETIISGSGKGIAVNTRQETIKTKALPLTDKNIPEKTSDKLILKVGEIYRVPNFHYGFKQADIVKNAEKELDTLYKIMVGYPKIRIQVSAYADCRGSAAFNLKLSYIRAHAVVRYLEQRGISANRLAYKGYGATRPVVKCSVCKECSEEQHQLNRGIEFKVLSL